MSIGIGIPNMAQLNLNTGNGGVNRQSLNTNFAGKLKNAARETTLTAQRTANYVAPYVPGAAILSASLSGVAQNLSADPVGARLSAGAIDPSVAGGGGDMMGVMQDLQTNMMSSNMQMIGMQRKFQQESEAYLMMSNMMKTKHDTSKNSINNIR